MSEKNIESKSIVPPQSLLCLRCGHKWYSRKAHSKPTTCPRCKSYTWDQKTTKVGRPRKKGGKE